MTKTRSATIKDVAAMADVSIATVSRALRMPDTVSPTTLAKVRGAVAELRFRPNVFASNLRSARSGVIVAVVPNIANPFFSEVIRGIELVAHENGYSVLIGESSSAAREEAYMNLAAKGQAEGLINFVGTAPKRRTEDMFPIVNACVDVPHPKVTTVDVDNKGAARSATDYLLDLGHTHIGFIAASGPNSDARERGYRDAMAAAGLPACEDLVARGDFTVECGVRSAEVLLDQRPDITALFCANDEIALGALNVCKRRGLRVPHDISIIGFDDISFAKHFDPPLTTVAQPMQDIGREAVILLLEIIADNKTPARKRVLPASLVVRGSTARAPRPV